MDLKQYEQTKFALAEIVRAALAVDSQNQGLQSAARDLLMRLADDRFNLMLVGRFSRGKSTLINALLGAPHLPTGILPLTSVITTVRYGSRARVVLNFRDSRLRREIPLTQLAEYVTQQSNPGNAKNVAYAEIELPVELLRRGVFFVDSPGLGSAIAENTQTTERFFPEADAFILITSYDSPLSDEENRALHRIQQTGKALFVVVNKQDMVNADEREQVLDYVNAQLQQFAFPSAPQILSVSARQALEAKQSRNSDLLAGSGMVQFEEALLSFLTEERAEAFLSSMVERIGDFLAQRCNAESVAEKRASYESLLGRLRELRKPATENAAGESLIDSDAASLFTLEFDRRSGCRICGEVLDAIFHFLSKHQYELSINREAQREHAQRHGFCGLHTWQYENIASPYGVCTAYPELAHRVAAELHGMAAHSSGAVASLAGSPENCVVCKVRIAAEKQAIAEAAAAVRRVDAVGRGHLPACCLPHLAMAVGALGKSRATEILLDTHARFFERIAEDAQRYALRHEALRRHLTSEEERRAAQLLLLMLAGHRSLSAPWRIESLF